MTNRKEIFTRIGLTTAALGACVTIIGCSSDEPEVQPVVQRAPAPPPPPPPPAVIPVDELIDQLGIDDRIYLAEDRAPATTGQRKAVLTFFDAFARGDDKSVMQMLSFEDQTELHALVETGGWTQATADISMIDLATGSLDGRDCVLAVFEVGDGYQPQLWYYQADDMGATFESAPTPPDIINRLSGDWIASWGSILEQERELAYLPDAELAEIEDETIASSGQSSGRRGGNLPGGGGAPGLRDPGDPIKPPGK